MFRKDKSFPLARQRVSCEDLPYLSFLTISTQGHLSIHHIKSILNHSRAGEMAHSYEDLSSGPQNPHRKSCALVHAYNAKDSHTGGRDSWASGYLEA